ncbi:MAG: DsbE family thiol:disulfide interchange protein [Kiloniellaceae bacterium]|nr:DsbE family thiol:disulfide interchange protein [Kiloniellaceae bacterium]
MMSETSLATESTRRSRTPWCATFLVPVAIFLVLMVALAWGLTRDPRELPSVLIGKPVPEFSLPPVQGRTLGLASTDLKGEVSLVNVFASWCTACREEHPLFMQLKADEVVPIHGLNHRDRPADAAKWLDDLGDPYTRTGADLNGRVSIEWGVYGVPETFVIGKDGRIAYKHIGAVTPEVLQTKILPMVESLRRAETLSSDIGESRQPGSAGERMP